MVTLRAHPYRSYMVEVAIHSIAPDQYCGGYMFSTTDGEVAGFGDTPLMPSNEMAEKVALSLALAAVDEKLRGESEAMQ